MRTGSGWQVKYAAPMALEYPGSNKLQICWPAGPKEAAADSLRYGDNFSMGSSLTEKGRVVVYMVDTILIFLTIRLLRIV